MTKAQPSKHSHSPSASTTTSKSPNHQKSPTPAALQTTDADSSCNPDEILHTLQQLSHFPPDPTARSPQRHDNDEIHRAENPRKPREGPEPRSLIECVLEDPAGALEAKKREWEDARIYLMKSLTILAEAQHNYALPRQLAAEQEQLHTRMTILNEKSERVQKEAERIREEMEREAALIVQYRREMSKIEQDRRREAQELSKAGDKLSKAVAPTNQARMRRRLWGTELNMQAFIIPSICLVLALLYTIVTDHWENPTEVCCV